MIPKWREIGLLVSYPSSEGYKAQASKHGTATLPVSCVDELYVKFENGAIKTRARIVGDSRIKRESHGYSLDQSNILASYSSSAV